MVFYNAAKPLPSNAQISVDCIVGPHKLYKTAEKTLNLVTTTGPDKDFYYIQTPVFYTCRGPLRSAGGNQALPYLAEDPNDHLRVIIDKLEDAAATGLYEYFKSDEIPTLQAFLKQFYLQHPILRSSFNKEDSTFWIKLDNNIRCFTWDKEKSLRVEDLGPGQYQMILRIGFIYLGQHGQSGCVASLNIRAVQLRYKPMDVKGGYQRALDRCLFQNSSDEEEEEEEMEEVKKPASTQQEESKELKTPPQPIPTTSSAPQPRPVLRRQNAFMRLEDLPNSTPKKRKTKFSAPLPVDLDELTQQGI